jgi:hypothetical protein
VSTKRRRSPAPAAPTAPVRDHAHDWRPVEGRPGYARQCPCGAEGHLVGGEVCELSKVLRAEARARGVSVREMMEQARVRARRCAVEMGCDGGLP